MKRKLSPRALYGLVGGALVVYALFGWFVLVGPKRAEAASLNEQVAAAEQTLRAARLAATVKPDAQRIEVADIFRLSTAMPTVPDMPGILLELSRVASMTGIEFNSITPQPSVAATGYQAVPISLAFSGNFYELADFLFRLRTLVGIRNGSLHSSGRLFVVRTITFAAAADNTRDITATLSVDAFVYGTATPAATATPPPTETPPTAGEAPVPPVEGESSVPPQAGTAP